MQFAIVVPWHDPQQIAAFGRAWEIDPEKPPPWLLLTQDKDRQGCGRTKNRGIRRALDIGSECIVILDDDCYPSSSCGSLEDLAEYHIGGLMPKRITMFRDTTEPPSRGTPYFCRRVEMPVVANMGFWNGIPDFDSCRQLTDAGRRASFKFGAVHGQYFPLCGMNLAFRATEWPWCQFVNVPRFDDIWAGFLWQRKAYSEGKCFHLGGPIVHHARQSNIWSNLKIEAENMERNETMWKRIATMPLSDHATMLRELNLSL